MMKKIILTLIGLLSATFVSAQAYDYDYMNNHMAAMHYTPWGYMGFGFGSLLMILFWVAIIWFAVWLFNNYKKTSFTKPESATEILKKRYAKGEINKKQYEDMKTELRK